MIPQEERRGAGTEPGGDAAKITEPDGAPSLGRWRIRALVLGVFAVPILPRAAVPAVAPSGVLAVFMEADSLLLALVLKREVARRCRRRLNPRTCSGQTSES